MQAHELIPGKYYTWSGGNPKGFRFVGWWSSGSPVWEGGGPFIQTSNDYNLVMRKEKRWVNVDPESGMTSVLYSNRDIAFSQARDRQTIEIEVEV